MRSHAAQTCCVPIRKLELLGGELRLLKGAIEQLHGRCELLLSEIADLRRDHELADEKFACEGERDSPDQSQPAEKSGERCYAEHLDTASIVSAAPVVGPGDEESRASVTGELSSPSPTVPCSDALAPIDNTDAVAFVADTPTSPHSRRADDSKTTPTEPTIEAAQSSEPLVSEITSPTVVVAESPANLPELPDEAAPPSPLGDESGAIIVLDDHRTPRTQRSRSTARATGRWAAAVALIIAVLAIAVASTGFAYGLAEFFTANSR